MTEALMLVVVVAPTGSTLRVGQTLTVPRLPAVIGRAADADVALDDRSVSRRHARLERVGGRLQVTCLAPHNGTYVQEVAVDPHGVPTAIPQGGALQLGGVVLRVGADEATVPVRQAIALHDRAPGAIVQVLWDGDGCAVHVGGRLLDLSLTPARVLATLAASAGQPVHRWDLQDIVGPRGSVKQQMSLVRRALRTALADGSLPRELVRERVNDLPGDADDSALVRALIRARRGHGYVLCLAPEDVTERTV